jgi:hypothetical protein
MAITLCAISLTAAIGLFATESPAKHLIPTTNIRLPRNLPADQPKPSLPQFMRPAAANNGTSFSCGPGCYGDRFIVDVGAAKR